MSGCTARRRGLLELLLTSLRLRRVGSTRLSCFCAAISRAGSSGDWHLVLGSSQVEGRMNSRPIPMNCSRSAGARRRAGTAPFDEPEHHDAGASGLLGSEGSASAGTPCAASVVVGLASGSLINRSAVCTSPKPCQNETGGPDGVRRSALRWRRTPEPRDSESANVRTCRIRALSPKSGRDARCT